MYRRTKLFALLAFGALGGSAGDAIGQPSPLLSFFVTSAGNGTAGGSYGGLAGADERCQSLASAAGEGTGTWRAYLSTAPIEGFGGDLVDARDRIGVGPWFNADGEMVAADVANLHEFGPDEALVLDEVGNPVPTSEHDILTGSLPDGSARTEFPDNPAAPPPNCFNWTSNSADAYTWVGHSDARFAWSSSHETTCDAAGLASTAGSGRLYCFRADAPEPGASAAGTAAMLGLALARVARARR